MKTRILSVCLLALIVGQGYAQKITATDSVLLFRTDSRVTLENEDMVKTKGKVTQVVVNSDGSADIAVYKQHVGFFKPTEKSKTLSTAVTTIPGLMQLRFKPGQGIEKVSEEVFNLNSGLNQPISYTLFDINASRPKDQVEVITNQNKGSDYNSALQKNPGAFEYKSDIWTEYIYDCPDRRNLVLTTQQGFYNPYAASEQFFPAKVRTVMALSAKPLQPGAASPVYYDYDSKTTIAYRSDDASFITLDTLGNVLTTEKVAELNGLTPLVQNTVFAKTEAAGMQDVYKAQKPIGVDFVFGIQPAYKGYKDGNFWIVRVGHDGKIKFKHGFQVLMDDYVPSGVVHVTGNDSDAIARVELRKGMLKYTFAAVKVNQGGIVYNRNITSDETKAMPVVRGDREGVLPGNTPNKDFFLVALPNNENLIIGQEGTEKEWFSYNILHLNADGSLKKLYCTGTVDKNQNPKMDRTPQPMLLNDGRLLLVTAESTGLNKALIAPYSNLDANLVDGYPASTQGFWKSGEKNLLFNATLSGNAAEKKGAGGFLERMAKTTEIGSLSSSTGGKAMIPVEPLTSTLYAPSVMLVDPKAGSMTRNNLLMTGAFCLPNQPILYADPATGKFSYFGRTLPERKARELVETDGQKYFATGTYLKVVQGEL